mmetsp:Transcript_64064/g.134690  ORF Transcript_64064/g.134690 Transcript_64064/m.134690 type:complete len:1060 (+) Transcript_64064:137-3316(+)
MMPKDNIDLIFSSWQPELRFPCLDQLAARLFYDGGAPVDRSPPWQQGCKQRRCWLIFLLGLAACPWVVCSAPTAAPDSVIGAWLHDLVFDVPYITLPGPMLDVEGGACSGLRIAGVQSQAISNQNGITLNYKLSGVRISCQIKMHDSNEYVSFVLNDTVVDYNVEVANRKIGSRGVEVPLGAATVTCQATIMLEKLDFQGKSVMTPVLESVHNNLRTILEREGPGIACRLSSDYIADQASAIMENQAHQMELAFAAKPPTLWPPAVVPLVDWSRYPPLQVISHLLVERPQAISALLGYADPLHIPQFSSPFITKIPTSMGTVQTGVLVRSVKVEGLKTLQYGSFLMNGHGSMISFKAHFGELTITLDIEVTLDFLSSPIKSQRPLREALNMTLDFADLGMDVDVLARVAEAALNQLYVDQIQQPRCIAECALQSTVPANHSLALWELRSEMTPTLGLSFRPGVLESQLGTAMDKTLAAAILDRLPIVQSWIEGSVQVQRHALSEAMWGSINSLPPCRSTQIYLGPGDVASALLLWGGIAVLLVGAAHSTWASSSKSKSSETGLLLMAPSEGNGKFSQMSASSGTWPPSLTSFLGGRDGEWDALAAHPCVHQAAVVLFPYIVASAMVLFLYADVSLATTIDFVFRYQGSEVVIGPSLAFSVVIIAVDAFKAKAYLIAACIAIMSITWPFIKLLMLFFAWLAPSKDLSPETRGRLLRFLDEYGKWSLIDTWLGVLALACYKLAWRSSTGEAQFLVDPVPQLPFFMFVFASVLTLILGHIASGYHRRAEEWDQCWEPPQAAPQLSITSQVSAREPLSKQLPPQISAGLVLSSTGCIALLILGSYLDSFQMLESGALAVLLLDDADRVASYSLMGLGWSMTNGKSDDAGLRMVQFIFFLFAWVIPIALQLVVLAMCILPLTKSWQTSLFDLCRALDAWAAFDVFAVAVTVSHMEFGLFSHFLMHYNNLEQGCQLVTTYLKTECFHMECGVTVGYAVLMLAAFLSSAVPKFAMKKFTEALDGTPRTEVSSSDSENSTDDADNGILGLFPQKGLKGIPLHAQRPS